MTKFVKIENPGYPEYNRCDYIVEETETQYICVERKLNKDFTVPGTCLVWRFLNSEEENHFLQEMRTIPIIEDANLISDIRLMSYGISREDLCSDGRELWYIVERYVSEKLESLNIKDRFFYFWCGRYYLATNNDKYDSTNWSFEPISDDMFNIIKGE